ncbi:MAG: hypothetical protein WAM30_19155, partial [Candidatus Dormiibacterota bacterium]
AMAYISISLPAILAGVLVTPLGLRPTFEIFGAAVSTVAVVVAGQAWRTRPARTQAPAPVLSACSPPR